MKGLSIITNFGCTTNCPYCIWKNHKLNNKTSDDLIINKLNDFISTNKISLSGGGDPLNEPEKHEKFWKNLINICQTKNTKIDIHTSYSNHIKIINKIFNKQLINRIVIHSSLDRFYKQIDKIGNFKYRFNFVVTNELDISKLIKIEKILKDRHIQLAYRELVSDCCVNQNISTFCKSISERYDLGRYVNQNDYNVYLMPNGQITDNFLF